MNGEDFIKLVRFCEELCSFPILEIKINKRTINVKFGEENIHEYSYSLNKKKIMERLTNGDIL